MSDQGKRDSEREAAPRKPESTHSGQPGNATSREALEGLLPLYAADSLGAADRQALEAHLISCADCRADLALWLEVGSVVAAEEASLPRVSPSVLDGALARARLERRSTAAWAIRRAVTLVRAQLLLLRHEIWLSSLLVMLLGYVVALLSGQADRAGSVVVALAPLVAAAGVALVYGPDVDPGLELALATPTSPRQVLLARLVVVFGYDLALALVATVGLLPLVPFDLLGGIALGWLGPMTFLSALALLLSLRLGAESAASISLGVWAVRWLARGLAPDTSLGSASLGIDTGGLLHSLARAIDSGFGSSLALLAVGTALFAVAFWLVGRESGTRIRQAAV